jgi:hypothetical protein
MQSTYIVNEEAPRKLQTAATPTELVHMIMYGCLIADKIGGSLSYRLPFIRQRMRAISHCGHVQNSVGGWCKYTRADKYLISPAFVASYLGT